MPRSVGLGNLAPKRVPKGVKTIPTPYLKADAMYLKHFYLDCLSHSSYLIGDEQTGTAVVIDPQRDIDIYLDEAERQGLTIKHVFLTHSHADFVAGHIELRERVGATIHLGAKATTEFKFTAAHDGESMQLGNLRLEFLETPGHTPESISIVLYDEGQDGNDPVAVFTGDTLFVGDVGRPDLLASVGVSANELGAALYSSLHDKLMTLPPATIVYPAHGAGSMCGKALSVERSSTIGRQLEENGALQPMTQGEFVAMVTADQPSAPAYFGFNAGLNRMERETLEIAMMSGKKPLLQDELLELQLQGAQVLDVREPEVFAAGHIPGAINIPLTSRFASWAGTLLDRERPVILVTEIGDEGDGTLRLGRIGYDIVIGYLAFAFAWDAQRTPLTTVARVTPDEFRAQREGDESTLVLDVRTCAEHAADKIEGSVNIPLGELRSRLDEVPIDRDLVLLCKTGERSSMGISLLQGEGFTRLTDMVGGFDAWTGVDSESAPTCQLS